MHHLRLILLLCCLATLATAEDPGDYTTTVAHDPPLIGIYHHTSPTSDLERQGLPVDGGGVSIVGVMPGSLASRSGLRPGDVIVSFDGKPIHGSGDIVREMGDHAAGDPVVIEYLRDGQRASIEGDLGVRPGNLPVTPLAAAQAEQAQAEAARRQEKAAREGQRRAEREARRAAEDRKRDAQLERDGWVVRWESREREDGDEVVEAPVEKCVKERTSGEGAWRLRWRSRD